MEYICKETGELFLSKKEMLKDFDERYDGGDPLNPITWDERYDIVLPVQYTKIERVETK